MGGAEQGKGERPPVRKPVTVIHFPKVGKKVARRATVSITELKAVGRDDDATDPHVVVTAEPKLEQTEPGRPSGRSRRKTQEPRSGEATLPEVQVEKARALKAAQEAADLAAFGHRLFEMGKLDEARVIFERLVGADTRDPFVHTMLGTVYLAKNQQEKALALFQAALKLDPDDLAAVVYRGEIRLNRGKVKSALEDLTRAVTLAPASDPFVERAKRLIKMAKALGKKKR